MKKFCASSAFIVILAFHNQGFAKVRTKINEKFLKNFPKNIAVVIPGGDPTEKKLALDLIKIIEKFRSITVPAGIVYPCINDDFSYNPAIKKPPKTCLPRDFISRINATNKLPPEVVKDLTKFPQLDGFLVVKVITSMEGAHAYAAGLILFDTKAGELIYGIELSCMSYTAQNQCNPDDISHYLNGDLKKKLKHVKLRE